MRHGNCYSIESILSVISGVYFDIYTNHDVHQMFESLFGKCIERGTQRGEMFKLRNWQLCRQKLLWRLPQFNTPLMWMRFIVFRTRLRIDRIKGGTRRYEIIDDFIKKQRSLFYPYEDVFFI